MKTYIIVVIKWLGILSVGLLAWYFISINNIMSPSMYPNIRINDLAIGIRPWQANRLQENDVISFRHNNVTMVHRIEEVVQIDGEYLYQTKGDNNGLSDTELVPFQDVRGKILLNIPYGGRVQLMLVVLLVLIIKRRIKEWKVKQKQSS
jgi:signal peptidase